MFRGRKGSKSGLPVALVPDPSAEESQKFLEEKRQREEETALRMFIDNRINLPIKEQTVLCLIDAGLNPDVTLLLSRPYCLDTGLRGGDAIHPWREISYGKVLGVCVDRGYMLYLDISSSRMFFPSSIKQIRFNCFLKEGWEAPWGELGGWQKTIKGLKFGLLS